MPKIILSLGLPKISKMNKRKVIFISWAALLTASLTMFGNYYLYDSVAYVKDGLQASLNFTQSQYGMLYSSYSIAAILILFISGVFVDKYGTRLSILIFSIVCTISGFVTAVCVKPESMIFSRFLLGLGAEPLIVAVTVAVAKWFKGGVLGFALGINLLVARLGSSMVDWSPTWGKSFYTNWQGPLILASLIGIVCTIGAIIYFFIEKYGEKNGLLGKAIETDKLNFKDLVSFNKSFWLVVALCVTFYSAIFPFRGFAPDFLQQAHHVTKDFSGRLMSWLPISAMFATPLFGLLVDKVGRRATMMFFGSIMISPVFLMLIYSHVSLYIPVAMLGVAFSLIPAVMWPSVAYIVSEDKLGTAYSLMTMIQQIGVAAIAFLIGKLNDVYAASSTNAAGYNPGMWLLSTLAIFGLIFSFWLRKAETGPNSHGLERVVR
jgi:MFS family permease